MTSQFSLREAIAKDAAGLKACMLAAYQPYLERLDGQPLPPMELDYADEINSYPTWVIEQDGIIVAGITMMFAADSASIANVAVHPDSQGTGLGGRLLRFAETQAKTRGYRELRLATHNLLTENIALYQHLGWHELARNEQRVILSKAL